MPAPEGRTARRQKPVYARHLPVSRRARQEPVAATNKSNS